MKDYDFSGMNVLVTGGRRGIGLALVRSFLQCGAMVIALARSPEPGELAELAADAGERLRYYPVNMLNREERGAVFQQITDRFGRIDILVNNAGEQEGASIFDYDMAHWDRDLELMLTAVFDYSVRAARVMRENGGGKIINVASISSFQGARNIAGYATAKHGLVGLTKCLANELAGYGININAVAPGIVDTDMAAEVFADPVKHRELAGRVPAGRFATTADIVPPVMFLASRDSDFIHGHVLLVDGGWMGR